MDKDKLADLIRKAGGKVYEEYAEHERLKKENEKKDEDKKEK